MAVAYVQKRGGTIIPIDPDGWCLIASVARAAPELGGQAKVLKQALQVVRDDLPMPGLSESERGAMKREAATMLQRIHTIGRRIGALCRTPLWDQVARALSRVSADPCTSTAAI